MTTCNIPQYQPLPANITEREQIKEDILNLLRSKNISTTQLSESYRTDIAKTQKFFKCILWYLDDLLKYPDIIDFFTYIEQYLDITGHFAIVKERDVELFDKINKNNLISKELWSTRPALPAFIKLALRNTYPDNNKCFGVNVPADIGKYFTVSPSQLDNLIKYIKNREQIVMIDHIITNYKDTEKLKTQCRYKHKCNRYDLEHENVYGHIERTFYNSNKRRIKDSDSHSKKTKASAKRRKRKTKKTKKRRKSKRNRRLRKNQT